MQLFAHLAPEVQASRSRIHGSRRLRGRYRRADRRRGRLLFACPAPRGTQHVA